MKSKKKRTKSKSTPEKLLRLSSSGCAKLALEWQRCLVGDLGNLFYAYNQAAETSALGQISQRVISFSLYSKDYNKNLLSKYKKGKSTIQIYMGCGGDPLNGEIPSVPKFQPFIQLYNSDMKSPVGYKNCYPLTWSVLPPYNIWLNTTKNSGVKGNTGLPFANVPKGGGIPITASISNLFVSSWCKSSFNDLPNLFEAPIADAYVARVRKYIFGSEVTDKIVAALKARKTPLLNVLMGVEKTSILYPFGFRPIIVASEYSDNNTVARDGTAKHLDEYFEFSTPCPPYCKDED